MLLEVTTQRRLVVSAVLFTSSFEVSISRPCQVFRYEITHSFRLQANDTVKFTLCDNPSEVNSKALTTTYPAHTYAARNIC